MLLTPDIKEVINAQHYRPSVSIIIPFETKTNLNTELTHSLKTAVDNAERKLFENYPAEVCKIIIQKLRNIISNLKYDTHKKSIAIYVSLIFEKVIYLDIPVEEKIIVDDTFEIRDLVYAKKQLEKYLVLLLSGKESRILVMNLTKFLRVKPDTPELVYAYMNDGPEKTGNFSDMTEHKQTLIEKFLSHIDSSLDDILKNYPLPLFVLGAEKIIGHFKHLTKHADAIVDYVHGNYENATFTELKEVLKPGLAKLSNLKKEGLIKRLETETGADKVVSGIKDVWQEAFHRNGRLLIVEKNYVFAAKHGATQDIIEEPDALLDQAPYIRDAVDDIIEKVLENGGDVEFVDDHDLEAYNHIALIKYY